MKETNRLIAEFMDLVKVDSEEELFYYVEDRKISSRFYMEADVEYCSPEELPYHLSWDWLMPVVEKIEQDTGWKLIMYSNGCLWNKCGDHPNDIRRYFTGSRQNAVYEAVVWFIEWYNTKVDE